MKSNRWTVGLLSLLALWPTGFVLLCLYAPWVERDHANDAIYSWLWHQPYGLHHLDMPTLTAELLAWTAPFLAVLIGFFIVRKNATPR
jgi:hypothetical protein